MDAGEEPVVWCLVARWQTGLWQTRCVDSRDVTRWIEAGWLNYMRDPFGQEAHALWSMEHGAD